MDLTPDLGAAILQYLKDSTDLTHPSMAGSNVVLEWPKKESTVVLPTSSENFINCVYIEAKKGGPGDIGLSLIDQRVIFKVYGKNKLQASNIWRVLNYYLLKPDGRTVSSFTRANTRVHQVFQEGGPNELVDIDAAGWPYIECSYIFRYCGIRVA